MKKYIAKTNTSINVVDADGKNIHVAFTPLTMGGSVFYTDDEKLQDAIERHYKFGRQIRVEEVAQKTAAPTTKASTEEAQQDDEEATTEEGDELKTITVTDAGSAKDYLANNFGVSRTKLKSIAQIKAVAQAHNIVFEGI